MTDTTTIAPPTKQRNWRDRIDVPVATAFACIILSLFLGSLYSPNFLSPEYLLQQLKVGAFLGAWLGGRLYNMTGSYDVVWWLAVALGVFAALINLPVKEQAIVRAQPAAA